MCVFPVVVFVRGSGRARKGQAKGLSSAQHACRRCCSLTFLARLPRSRHALSPCLIAPLRAAAGLIAALSAGASYCCFIAAPSLSSFCVRDRSVAHLVLVFEDGKERMVHKVLIHLLELLERVLVVLAGALCQDVHLEVRVRHFLLVSLLVCRCVLLALALERLLHKTNSKTTSWSVSRGQTNASGPAVTEKWRPRKIQIFQIKHIKPNSAGNSSSD